MPPDRAATPSSQYDPTGVNTEAEPTRARTRTERINAGYRFCEAEGIAPPSHQQMKALIRRFEATQRPEESFANYLRLTYVDPTGETAARNVDRPRRAA